MDSLNRHEDYGQEALDETHLGANPIEQLKRWLLDAEAEQIYEPNAFVLGTVDQDGQPTSRTVLLKGFSDEGLFFATNYLSRKGEAVSQNPKVSAVFGWYSMYRQVLIQGVAHKVVAPESDEYFHSRPASSRIGAWASPQSAEIPNREFLEEAEKRFSADFGDQAPRPEHWGGYRLRPTEMEFWQGRPSRLHDRIHYQLDGAQWRITRLAP